MTLSSFWLGMICGYMMIAGSTQTGAMSVMAKRWKDSTGLGRWFCGLIIGLVWPLVLVLYLLSCTIIGVMDSNERAKGTTRG